jgi:thiosulfate dehydrogenase [quinone] large subunit
MKTSSIVLIIVATLLGLFFGNALGGIVWALILGVISGAAGWLAARQYETSAPAVAGEYEVPDPPFARFLFADVRSAALWLPIRLFVGWEWLEAGWHKFQDPKWMTTGDALKGFWTGAVAVPETGRPPITYEWWRGFIQGLLDIQAYTWFAKLITLGEIAVGLGLITGTLVGIAAFGGALMNMSFLLSGSTSSNPILFLLAMLLVLGWKVAGWIGLDRWLLPALGTPWRGGALFRREAPPAVVPPTP